MTTRCLNMIVRDEAHVIGRCLESVRPHIQAWAILDTGSTDGTQALVREALAGIPGVLAEAPWTDFGQARTQALALAAGRADHLLFLDADDVLVCPEGYRFPDLEADAVLLRMRLREGDGTVTWTRRALVRERLPWRWEGVIHEHLVCGAPVREVLLEGPSILASHEGRRGQDPERHAKDIRVLEEALAREPGHARYAFYLAQACELAGRHEEAVRHYRHRVSLGGWEEEVHVSLLQLGRNLRTLGRPSAEVVEAFLQAHERRSVRAEPLVELARHHRERRDFHCAHLFATRAAALARPDDVLFVEEDAYAWRALDEWAVAAYWIGRHAECRDLCRRLLDEGRLPEAHRARVQGNLAYALQGLGAARG